MPSRSDEQRERIEMKLDWHEMKWQRALITVESVRRTKADVID